MKYIIFKKWFYYVVQKWGTIIYTYAVCDTEEKAKEILEFIEKQYG